MSQRYHYTTRKIFEYYRKDKMYPAYLWMHPWFYRELKGEDAAFMHIDDYSDAAGPRFNGILILQTEQVHALRCMDKMP